MSARDLESGGTDESPPSGQCDRCGRFVGLVDDGESLPPHRAECGRCCEGAAIYDDERLEFGVHRAATCRDCR
jgi:hypothetical protein